MAASAPTLTYKATPVPSVEVYWSTLPAGTTSITVYRTIDGERSVIRNASNVNASGSFAVIDYEAPFGTIVTYSGETFVVGVSGGISATGTITLNVTDAWIQDPLDQTSAISVSLDSAGTSYTLGQNSFSQLSRSTNVNKLKVLGRSKPVSQSYGRSALEGIELSVYSDNATFGAFNNLLDVQPLLVRLPTGLKNMPRSLYCVVTSLEEPIDWQSAETTGLTRFTLTLDEVEGQTLTVLVSFYSYSDYAAKYATYTAANAVYGSTDYTYVVRNPLL